MLIAISFALLCFLVMYLAHDHRQYLEECKSIALEKHGIELTEECYYLAEDNCLYEIHSVVYYFKPRGCEFRASYRYGDRPSQEYGWGLQPRIKLVLKLGQFYTPLEAREYGMKMYPEYFI